MCRRRRRSTRGCSDGRSAPDPSFEAPGLIGELDAARSAAPAPGAGPLLWLAVDRLDDALEAVTAAGGAVLEPPSVDGSRLLATVRDPGGNLVGLAQHGV